MLKAAYQILNWKASVMFGYDVLVMYFVHFKLTIVNQRYHLLD